MGEACNCLVVWDPIKETHVWVSGTLNGSCGHPATGTAVDSAELGQGASDTPSPDSGASEVENGAQIGAEPLTWEGANA